jgi:hypothetical protein
MYDRCRMPDVVGDGTKTSKLFACRIRMSHVAVLFDLSRQGAFHCCNCFLFKIHGRGEVLQLQSEKVGLFVRNGCSTYYLNPTECGIQIGKEPITANNYSEKARHPQSSTSTGIFLLYGMVGGWVSRETPDKHRAPR